MGIASPRQPVNDTIGLYFAMTFGVVALLFLFGAFNYFAFGFGDISKTLESFGSSNRKFIITKASLLAVSTAVILLLRPRALGLFVHAWPATLLFFWGFASSLWSPNPLSSISGSISYASGFVIAVAVVCILSFQRSVALIVHVCALIVFVSVALCLSLPSLAVHQSTYDFSTSLEGSWHGVFTHRTLLGHFAAVSLFAFLCFRRHMNKYFFAASAILAGVCIMMSTSAGAIASLFVLLFCFLYFSVLERSSLGGRYLLLLFLALLVALAVAALDFLLPLLLGMLDKDPTLTGRTLIWSILVQLITERPFLGYGFRAGYVEFAAPRLIQVLGMAWHSHNGYIQALISFGGIGLCLFLLTFLHCIQLVVRHAKSADPLERSLFRLVLCITGYTLFTNIIEGWLLSTSNFSTAFFWFLYLLSIRVQVTRAAQPDTVSDAMTA